MKTQEKERLINYLCKFIEKHKEHGEHCSFCLGYNEGLYDLRIAIEQFLVKNDEVIIGDS